MQILDNTIEHLESWLNAHEKNQNVVPIVKKILLVLKWKRDVLNTIPAEVKNKIKPIFISEEHDQSENKSIVEVLQIPEPPNSEKLLFVFNNTVAGSSSILSPVGILEPLNSVVASWAVNAFESFQQVEEEIDAPVQVRKLLDMYFPELIDEYDLIENNYFKSFSELELRVNTCTAMRVFLERFKGIIFKNAMRIGEQKINWAIMTERLCRNRSGSIEYELLLDEEKNYDSIHLNCTNYFKNRDRCTAELVKIERIKLIAHLFNVMNLLSI